MTGYEGTVVDLLVEEDRARGVLRDLRASILNYLQTQEDSLVVVRESRDRLADSLAAADKILGPDNKRETGGL